MNKLAPLCCGRWGFCQTTTCVRSVAAGHVGSLRLCSGLLEVRRLYKTRPLAALLDMGLDISLKNSHVGRAESVADWKGQVA